MTRYKIIVGSLILTTFYGGCFASSPDLPMNATQLIAALTEAVQRQEEELDTAAQTIHNLQSDRQSQGGVTPHSLGSGISSSPGMSQAQADMFSMGSGPTQQRSSVGCQVEEDENITLKSRIHRLELELAAARAKNAEPSRTRSVLSASSESSQLASRSRYTPSAAKPEVRAAKPVLAIPQAKRDLASEYNF